MRLQGLPVLCKRAVLRPLRLPRLAKLPVKVFPGRIVGQSGLQRGGLPAQRLGQLPALRRLFQRPVQHLQPFLRPCGFLRRCIQRRAALFRLLGASQGALYLLQLRLRRLRLPLQGSQGRGVPVQQTLRQLQRLRQRQRAVPRPLQRLLSGAVRRPPEGGEILLYPRRGLLPPVIQLGGAIPQPVLKDPVAARAEQLPKDVLPFPGVRQQQPQKISLGQHGNLGKLLPVYPQNAAHRVVHIPHPGEHPAVGKRQLRLGLFGGHTAAATGPLIFRAAAELIGLSAVGKGQRNLRGRLREGVFGAQHSRLPAAAAGLAVKGIGNCIKQRGLSRAGVPGDQIKSPLPQCGKIHRGPARVGAKGGQLQAQWSHSPSSQICRISAAASSVWQADSGVPFCFS